jgi:pyrroloquinoline quinone (PQQ) biosynthesis protein C
VREDLLALVWPHERLKDAMAHLPMCAAGLRDDHSGACEMRAFLIDGWLLIEKFPHYVEMNLLKLVPKEAFASRVARRYFVMETVVFAMQRRHARAELLGIDLQ